MAASKFPTFRDKIGKGEIDLLTDNLKFAAFDFDDLGVAITGATNATPIVITTGAIHGLTTGDEVIVDGVLGNTAANVAGKVTVLSTTTFELDGTVGSGAYTSGGRVISLTGLEFHSHIVAAIVAESGTLTGKTLSNGYFSSDDGIFTSISGDTWEAAVLFKDTGVSGTSPLISIHAGLSILPDSEGITLTISGPLFRI